MRDFVRLVRTRVGKAALAAAVIAGLLAIALPARAQSSAVTIQNFSFQPGTMQIPVGATVTWTNKDSTTHTSTSDTGVWDSGNISTNSSFSFTFNQAGTFTYHCKIHPNMTGSIVVGASAAATSTTAPVATAAATSTSVPSTTATPVINVANNPKLGAILVNGAGMTLYTLSSEAGGVFKCTGGCLNVWPPVLLPAGVSAPTLGAGVTGAVGSITRPDGTVQVTYQGLPLYLFSRDTAPGMTNGNGIVAFGGVWRAAAVQSVALSATPAETLIIRISRVSGSPAGRVAVRFRVGGAQEHDVCSASACTLYVPRGDSVTLRAISVAGRFVGWKIPGKGAAGIVHQITTHLALRTSERVTALFRAR